MEWDSKVPSWDLTELEQNVEPSVSSIVSGSSAVIENPVISIDCSIDLKLGGLGEFRPPVKLKDQYRPAAMMVPSSLASPSKRARPPSNAIQNASCSVDGCKADLSHCREYHRRHKVCEMHSKTPVVKVGGQEQRFCQQCSRFHLLVEFDEVKRSCRKRLDGHNRRRRKPHPESTNAGSLFPAHQVGRFLTYPHIFQSPIAETNWTGTLKIDNDATYAQEQHLHVMNNQTSFAGSFTHGYKKEKQFHFLPEGETAFTRPGFEAPTCQPLKTISSAESSSSKLFSDELTQVLDSDCALSLLSSSAQTSSINMGQMLSSERIPMGQPLVSNLQYSNHHQYSGSRASSSVSVTRFSCSAAGEDQVRTILVSDTDVNLRSQAMFHEGSSDGVSQSLPFTWQ